MKTDENVRERWAELMPEGPTTVPFTVEGLLLAMVKGEMKPLYQWQSDGKPATVFNLQRDA